MEVGTGRGNKKKLSGAIASLGDFGDEILLSGGEL